MAAWADLGQDVRWRSMLRRWGFMSPVDVVNVLPGRAQEGHAVDLKLVRVRHPARMRPSTQSPLLTYYQACTPLHLLCAC